MTIQAPAYCLLGLPFHAVAVDDAVACIRRAIETRVPLLLTTPNVNFVVACSKDAAFCNAVIDSDLLVADGMPLVWIARLLGLPLRDRVAGSEIFQQLRLSAPGPLGPVKVFFFGGPPGVAEAAAGVLNAEARGMVCVGWYSPGYGSVESMSTPEVIDHINASRADFLVVALGAAKGQAWIQHNRAKLVVPVKSHLGAVVNFVAGTVSRAPRWMQRVGLEWLWRIKEEPGLWKRYWADGSALLRLLLTCVLPLAAQGRILRWSRAAPGTLELVETGSGRHKTTVLRLSGTWHAGNLDPLSTSIAGMRTRPGALCFDLRAVGSVDAAFVALLLQLHGQRLRNGLPMAVEGAAGAVVRVFRWCRAGQVLGEHAA